MLRPFISNAHCVLLLRSVYRVPPPRFGLHLRISRQLSSSPNLYSDKSRKNAAVKDDPISEPEQTATPPSAVVPIWDRLGPVTSALNAYARSQKQRPWATQFFATVVIYFIADITAQKIGGDEHDPQRTVRNLIIGGVSAIPTYYWFLFLSNNFNYSSRILSLGVKVLVNLAVWTPAFNTYFFGSQALLSGSSFSGIIERISFTVPTSTVNSWKFWPWVTAFSFTFVPVEFRSVFASVIAIGWQAYLAWLNRQAEMIEEGPVSTAMGKPESSEVTPEL